MTTHNSNQLVLTAQTHSNVLQYYGVRTSKADAVPAAAAGSGAAACSSQEAGRVPGAQHRHRRQRAVHGHCWRQPGAAARNGRWLPAHLLLARPGSTAGSGTVSPSVPLRPTQRGSVISLEIQAAGMSCRVPTFDWASCSTKPAFRPSALLKTHSACGPFSAAALAKLRSSSSASPYSL